MDYQHARTLLKRHAGVGLSTDDDLQSSLTAAVWELQRSGKSSDFAQTFREILSCLEVVNQEINGPIPSESVERVSLPDVELVHAVSTILHAGWLPDDAVFFYVMELADDDGGGGGSRLPV